MKFSLIMATLNRTKEVEDFLQSLCNQTYKDFELIIVDQNEDNKLDDVISRYNEYMYIRHLRSRIKGLSHARNIGIMHSNGEILAFPDDDCIYPEDLLERVDKIFEKYDSDGISIIQKDHLGEKIPKRFNKKIININRWLVWTHVSSIRLFLRRNVLEDVGYFDNDLGVGEVTKWKAAEDIDLPIRALNKGCTIKFIPDIYVIHEISNSITSDDIKQKKSIEKAYEYSAASGYVMRKHNFSMLFLFAISFITILNIISDWIIGNKLDAVKRCYALKGRFHGYIKKKIL